MEHFKNKETGKYPKPVRMYALGCQKFLNNDQCHLSALEWEIIQLKAIKEGQGHLLNTRDQINQVAERAYENGYASLMVNAYQWYNLEDVAGQANRVYNRQGDRFTTLANAKDSEEFKAIAAHNLKQARKELKTYRDLWKPIEQRGRDNMTSIVTKAKKLGII